VQASGIITYYLAVVNGLFRQPRACELSPKGFCGDKPLLVHTAVARKKRLNLALALRIKVVI
jgi:hypothetical protein